MFRSIDLSNGRSQVLVSDEDFCLVAPYRWYPSAQGYAVSSVKRNGQLVQVYMHRMILPTAQIVDHINGNRLDNRRSNLRAASESINRLNLSGQKRNTSGRIGVSWNSGKGKWVAAIKFQGSAMRSAFLNFDDAVKCREAWEISILGHTLNPARGIFKEAEQGAV